ncbi:translocation/assembly module TamB domain-containing protein [Luteimonas composti]|uniref:Translocation/assembly module TamB domain-containing protein n=1 Tax=Luteimonas composti TaxID=398257 RepID=A0ABT6MNI8_9GAMM|nr:translocation/assembly module TamB domain-containing protein [Luteimonas composti]MDH7452149.1 translocation/assembly module TamB domain-containing protein [Luteimonas composti]
MAFPRRSRLPDDISPEERERRIAELRERRRRRLRVLAVRSALATGALAVLGAVLLYWLLTTFGGRDFLLARIVAALPAGTELTWARAEGPASGPLVLHDVRYVQRGCPDVDGEPVPYGQCEHPTVLTFGAHRVVLDPAITPLIGRRLRLDALDVEGAALDLPEPADTPFELPTWPEVLPRIDLPLSLQADTIRVDGLHVTRTGQPLIDIASIRGGLDARQGELRIASLVIDSDRGRFAADGVYAPDDNYRTDLTASALLPASFPRPRPRIGLVARGDLDLMDVAVVGHAPDPLRLALALRGRQWSLRADSNAFDPALLTGGEAGEPMAFSLQADGIGGAADARGELRRGTLHAVLQPSKLKLEEQVLDLQPLVLDVFDGRITARGRGDFSEPRAADFRFAVNARGLRLGGDPQAHDPEPADPAPAVGIDADLGIAGTSRAWAVIGKADLARDELRAQVELDGRGDLETLRLAALRATTPGGRLDATGEVGWAPALRWDLDATLAGFDPGYFVPAFDGAIDGRIASRGSLPDDGGLELDVQASELGGQLRGRRIAGQATFAMHGPATGQTRTDYEGEAALTIGGSRVDARGTLAERLELDARFSPLDLADLLPEAAGRLSGTLQARGARETPDLEADLEGSGLRWGDYAAASLSVRGRLPWSQGGGDLVLEGSGFQAGVALDQARVHARGAVENLALDAQARSGELGTLALQGSARRDGPGWGGALDGLQLQLVRGPAWRLQAPARWSQRGAAFTLSRSCLGAEGGGALCAEADWPRRGVSVAGLGLPLTLVTPWLPEREGGRPWVLRGDVDFEGRLRPAGRAWAGELDLRSADGGLRNSARSRNDLLGYRDLRLQADFNAARIEASLSTVFNEDGHVRARVSTGWDASSPLAGELSAETDELTWLELFSPDIVEPAGRLTADLQLGGRRATPTLGGQARLSGFSTELPALGILLESGDVSLDAQDDGSARIGGSVLSGGGRLAIDGSLNWRDARAPLLLRLTGDDVVASNTRDLRIVADPDIELRYAAGQPLTVTGTVAVPSALIDLERLDQGVSTSPDVVVLDPVDPDDGPGSPLQLDLTLAMGEDVRLRGFGLDGTLGGSMRVRAYPGREMTGSGTLEVGGRYTAYGQKLQVTRGRLTFDGPVSDPRLDIRAERRIEAEDVTAGISVTGRASAPQADVWTDPASDNSQALSYLALGRPLSNLSSAEGRQLDAASAALTAGGSMLAGQLGAKLGLDDAGVSESRALGGSVLGIGKQLSPRLYVGFGVSLLGTGQVLTLKYLLRRGFDIEIESSTLESRGSVNYRHESD